MNRLHRQQFSPVCLPDAPAFRHYMHAQNYIWLIATRMAAQAQACTLLPERCMTAASAFSLFDVYARMVEPESPRRIEALALRDEMASLCSMVPVPPLVE